MRARLAALREQLGATGLAALAVIALSVTFSLAAVSPLETRRAQLERQLAPSSPPAADGLRRVRSVNQSSQLEAFYRFFERPERTDEWLAKVYGIATASGIALRSGDYRFAETRRRLDRYQITLPVSGSYAQIRSFLSALLAEIPVLSLDQVSFRRKASTETRVDAELILTLHLPHR